MDRGAGARTWKGSQNPLREERRRGGDAVLASQVDSGDSERRNKGRDLLPTDEPEPDEEEQLGEAEAEDGKSARTSDDTFMGFKKKLKPSKARKSEEGNVRL